MSTQTVQDFFAWRQDPDNAAAYGRVESVWKGARSLSESADINDAVSGALGRASRPPQTRRREMGLAGLAVAAVTAFAAIGFWTSERGLYRTAVGEQRVIELADGSTVRLDTNSAVRVRFERGQRGLVLERGQALFTVAHDADRPFIVNAGDTSVTAVGTVFDVRRQGPTAQITLVSGVVKVEAKSGGAQRRLIAGEQATLTPAGPLIRTVDADTVTAWSSGRLIFRDKPLAQAVAEVNRYLDEPIVLNAPDLGSASVNGVVRTGDRAAFVEMAAATFGLRVDRDPKGRVRLSEEKNSTRAPG